MNKHITHANKVEIKSTFKSCLIKVLRHVSKISKNEAVTHAEMASREIDFPESVPRKSLQAVADHFVREYMDSTI
jgi:hypothetical protein